jgi:threonine aldolase
MHFGSDNQSGASPRVMAAILAANTGRERSYGGDSWTARAVDELRNTFECDLDAYFVATGTAANSLALSCLAQPWESILCHSYSHIIIDESTAPEFFAGGARLVGISQDGKLEPHHLDNYFKNAVTEVPHNPRASVLSITQASENGLVYTPDELTALTSIAHQRRLKVQMDGARFANAVAALGCAPADVSWRAGIDVLCLGATKNGAIGAEAVIFFDRALAETFVHRRKRAGHLLSKGRFLGAQIAGWLEGGHWLELAKHANSQAALLAKELATIPAIRLAWPTQANEVFTVLPIQLADRLKAAGAEFFTWSTTMLPPTMRIGEDEIYVRMVTSYVTTDDDVTEFCSIAKK